MHGRTDCASSLFKSLLDELKELVIGCTPRAGELTSFPALPHLQCGRFVQRSELAPVVEDSMIALVLQGVKRTVLGSHSFEYGAGHLCLCAVNVPVSGQIVQASADEPFLVVGLRVQPQLIAELLLKAPAPASGATPLAVATSQVSEELLDAVRRYLRLLDAPHDIPVLGAAIEREMLWRAMQGPHGEALYELGLANSNLALIGRAVEELRHRYMEPLRMSELARIANMSEPTFNRYFRRVTTMSPLQFQKLLRLQEARVRLLADDTAVTTVAFDVGYQSPSQFSREYRRTFGVPPGAEGKDLRRSGRPRHRNASP